MAVIAVPKPLRERLGEEGTDALVEVLNQVIRDTRGETLASAEERFTGRLTALEERIDGRFTALEERFENRFALLEERFERRLSEEIGKVNQRLTEEIGKVNQRLTEEVSRLDQKISAVQANIIKWMFIFWVGQVGMITAILFAFFRVR
jgi:hypothetical protein